MPSEEARRCSAQALDGEKCSELGSKSRAGLGTAIIS
jgi:hypothetical protein